MCGFVQGANALVTYAIISGADDSFRIDPESGELIATKRLDRERRSKYSLLVRADDGQQSSDVRVNITVSDVNDHPPKFSRSVYSFDIPEDMNPGTTPHLSITPQRSKMESFILIGQFSIIMYVLLCFSSRFYCGGDSGQRLRLGLER